MKYSPLSYTFVASNPDIYFRIDERQSNDIIHAAIKNLAENDTVNAIDPLISVAFKTVLIQFKAGRFSLDYLHKILNKEEYSTFKSILDGYQKGRDPSGNLNFPGGG